MSQVVQHVVHGSGSGWQVLQGEVQPDAKITVPTTSVARMILRSIIFSLKYLAIVTKTKVPLYSINII